MLLEKVICKFWNKFGSKVLIIQSYEDECIAVDLFENEVKKLFDSHYILNYIKENISKETVIIVNKELKDSFAQIIKDNSENFESSFLVDLLLNIEYE